MPSDRDETVRRQSSDEPVKPDSCTNRVTPRKLPCIGLSYFDSRDLFFCRSFPLLSSVRSEGSRLLTTEALIPTSGEREPFRWSRRLRRAGTLAAASIAASAIWVVAVPVAGFKIDVHFGTSTRAVGLASILIVPLIAGGAGWALLAILERMTARARSIWTILGWSILVLSVLGPLCLGVGASSAVTLITMHIAVGVTLIFGLTRFAAPRGE